RSKFILLINFNNQKATSMMWSADQYLDELHKEAVSIHKKNYGYEWKQEIKDNIKKVLGAYEDYKGDFNHSKIERVDTKDYERLRIEINTISSSLKMPVYVLIPKEKSKEKTPAVLAIHGHGYGSKALVGLNPDGSIKTEEEYHKNFAIKLVKKGVVVFVP